MNARAEDVANPARLERWFVDSIAGVRGGTDAAMRGCVRSSLARSHWHPHAVPWIFDILEMTERRQSYCVWRTPKTVIFGVCASVTGS